MGCLACVLQDPRQHIKALLTFHPKAKKTETQPSDNRSVLHLWIYKANENRYRKQNTVGFWCKLQPHFQETQPTTFNKPHLGVYAYLPTLPVFSGVSKFFMKSPGLPVRAPNLPGTTYRGSFYISYSLIS